MPLSYKYKRVKRAEEVYVKTPSIPVFLSGIGGKYQFIALLDTGADTSVIPKEVAELLGLEIKGKTEEAKGIGGKVLATQTKMKIEFGKPHENYAFDLPVKVILEGGEGMPVLIGRQVFFDKFIITFDQKEDKIILKANN